MCTFFWLVFVYFDLISLVDADIAELVLFSALVLNLKLIVCVFMVMTGGSVS